MRIKNSLVVSAVALSMALSSAAFADGPGGPSGSENEIEDGSNGNIQDSEVLNLENLLNGSLNDNAADSYSMTVSKTYSSADSSTDDDYNGATVIKVAANQFLAATNNNSQLDEVVDLDGEDESPTAVGYNSGDNYVRGNAFSAFAGVMAAAWNTGINANTQAANNIAAQGTVNFGANGTSGGSVGVPADAGNGGDLD
jgi:hypothetical protein